MSAVPVEDVDFLVGRAVLLMVVPGLPASPVNLLNGVRKWAAVRYGRDLAAKLDPGSAGIIARHLRHKAAAEGTVDEVEPEPEKRDLMARLASLPNWAEIMEQPPPTTIAAPLGYVSTDGGAVLGRRGHAFLLGGSNGPLAQALEDVTSPMVQDRVEAWATLLTNRVRKCAAAGVRFLQVLIPDKQSVMVGELPAELPVPSATWRALEARLVTQGMSEAEVVSALPTLRTVLAVADPYLQLDTHLSPAGAHAVFNLILGRMGLEPPFQPTFSEETSVVGDLSLRMFRVPLPEIVLFPDARWAAGLGKPELTERVEPNGGGHIGNRYVWRNPMAPFSARVVCFGNSYFADGAEPRWLSWWFARAFREFHLLWQADLDMDYVTSHRPDWVFCQTVERFLLLPPTQ